MPVARLPPHSFGLRVGLFGGSFNPAHQGHLHASKLALKRLCLDRVWWLVTPGNPLKDTSGLPPLAVRIAAARRLARDPRIVVTGLEAEIGTRYTFDTIAYLRRRCPGVRFVWIMGSDILGQFHRWQRWREIASALPLAIIDRPGATCPTLGTPAGHWLAGRRLPEREAALLAEAEPPAFVFLHGPRMDISSSLLRQAGHSPADS
ncbi:MAG: nicotinate-nucleotide adenylyltransferase [Beijerinckiaceae bacterium]